MKQQIDKKKREKFRKFIDKFMQVIGFVLSFGITFFSMIAFIFSTFLTINYFQSEGIETGLIFQLPTIFAFWVATMVWMFFIYFLMKAAHKNDKNWIKEKKNKKEGRFEW